MSKNFSVKDKKLCMEYLDCEVYKNAIAMNMHVVVTFQKDLFDGSICVSYAYFSDYVDAELYTGNLRGGFIEHDELIKNSGMSDALTPWAIYLNEKRYSNLLDFGWVE